MKGKKSFIILGVILLLIIVGFSYCRSTKKTPVDWTPSFYNTHTSPYGTYIAYHLLKDVFPNGRVVSTRRPIYNNLKDTLETYFSYNTYPSSHSKYNLYDYHEEESYDSEEDDVSATEGYSPNETNENQDVVAESTDMYKEFNISDTTSYIFVNSSFTIDKLDLEYLLDFVGMGNNIFISAESIDRQLLDTFKIREESEYFTQDSVYTLVDYPDKEFTFRSVYSPSVFNLDKCPYNNRVLASDVKGRPIFVQISYGKGRVYLHSVPIAFSNIHLLNLNKYDFAFRSLSYLPASSKVIWDEYQKQGMANEGSIFRELYASPPLKIAFWLILSGLVLFMIFRAKRIQRIIPTIIPPQNASLEFLDTVSNLYYRYHDFVTIVQKRHTYFLEYIRKNYYMQTEQLDDEFINALSLKSGVEKERLIDLFKLFEDINTSYDIENEVFLRYNELLEGFYKIVENNKN